jgi:hypothetical protein
MANEKHQSKGQSKQGSSAGNTKNGKGKTSAGMRSKSNTSGKEHEIDNSEGSSSRGGNQSSSRQD